MQTDKTAEIVEVFLSGQINDDGKALGVGRMGWFENCYTSQVDELLPGHQAGAKQPAVVVVVDVPIVVDVVPVVVAIVVARVEAVGEGAEKGR